MAAVGSGSPIDPSYQFAVVTPSDTALLSYAGEKGRSKGIYVGTTGNLAVKDDKGNSVTFVNVLAGVIHPISTDQILFTGTSALNIIALF
jgi:hypothetical protein